MELSGYNSSVNRLEWALAKPCNSFDTRKTLTRLPHANPTTPKEVGLRSAAPSLAPLVVVAPPYGASSGNTMRGCCDRKERGLAVSAGLAPFVVRSHGCPVGGSMRCCSYRRRRPPQRLGLMVDSHRQLGVEAS